VEVLGREASHSRHGYDALFGREASHTVLEMETREIDKYLDFCETEFVTETEGEKGSCHPTSQS
jgi:hypothetical protein